MKILLSLLISLSVALLVSLFPPPAQAVDPGKCLCIQYPRTQMCASLSDNNKCYPGFEPTCTTSYDDCTGSNNCKCTTDIPTPAPNEDKGDCTCSLNPFANTCNATNTCEPNYKAFCTLPNGECGHTDNCKCIHLLEYPKPTPEYISNICKQAGPEGSKSYKDCTDCMGGSGNTGTTGQGVWTGLGCISFKLDEFISNVLTIGLGLAGGFVLLLILYGAFLIITASGNPEQVQQGQQVVGAAIMGLLFIIFSVVIMKIIGVDILDIPDY